MLEGRGKKKCKNCQQKEVQQNLLFRLPLNRINKRWGGNYLAQKKKKNK